MKSATSSDAMKALSVPVPNNLLATVRELEFQRLHSSGQVYLDYTGAALYPEALLKQHFQILRRRVFGNPHSTHPASLSSTGEASAARAALLRFLDADADEYDVVWTANASEAIRLVGESFPFGADAPFVLTADNHNAVNGIRSLARARGATVTYLPLADDLRVLPFQLAAVTSGLFAFPAQSNFSGVQHPLEWVGSAQRQGYRVLVDVAAYVPTHAFSLRVIKPDFVALSLYKICGYPTGVGALVARRAALRTLARPSFSGGTVDFVSVLTDRYQLRPDSAAFEDGTGNFLAWSAVRPALRLFERMGMQTIEAQVAALAERALHGLFALHHTNGALAIELYGPKSTNARGGTIAFNVLDAQGEVVDYEHVVTAAAGRAICLRGGCFCNPGAAERAFRYNVEELATALDAVAGNFSIPAMRAALNNKPVGAVRASFGYGSRSSDVEALLTFLESYIHTT